MIRRLLMTADTVGGVWTYALELCRALAAHRVEVVLATLGAALDRSQAAAVAALSNVEVAESEYRLEWMREPWRDIEESGAWLLELARRCLPDLVHLNGYAHGSLPFAAPVLVVGHSCVLSWWRAVKGEPAPPGWEEYARRVALGLRAADLVVAPTAAMLRALEQLYGPLPRTRVIANGRRAELFPPLPKEPWVLCAGRLWDEAKNVQALARVAPRLAWPVLVAGAGDAPEPGSQAPLHGLRPLGQLPPADLARWLGLSSIYALPARYEPFGLSILEAALAGCALVLGEVESLRELWDGRALFVPADDEDALAAALGRLIRDPRARRLRARRARRRALAFGPERMAVEYLAAYGEAAAARARRGPARTAERPPRRPEARAAS